MPEEEEEIRFWDRTVYENDISGKFSKLPDSVKMSDDGIIALVTRPMLNFLIPEMSFEREQERLSFHIRREMCPEGKIPERLPEKMVQSMSYEKYFFNRSFYVPPQRSIALSSALGDDEDNAFINAKWSPSGCGLNNSCLLAVLLLDSTLRIQIMQGFEFCKCVELCSLSDMLESFLGPLDSASQKKTEVVLERKLDISANSFAWSSIFTFESLSFIFIALGAKSGRIYIYRISLPFNGEREKVCIVFSQKRKSEYVSAFSWAPGVNDFTLSVAYGDGAVELWELSVMNDNSLNLNEVIILFEPDLKSVTHFEWRISEDAEKKLALTKSTILYVWTKNGGLQKAKGCDINISGMKWVTNEDILTCTYNGDLFYTSVSEKEISEVAAIKSKRPELGGRGSQGYYGLDVSINGAFIVLLKHTMKYVPKFWLAIEIHTLMTFEETCQLLQTLVQEFLNDPTKYKETFLNSVWDLIELLRCQTRCFDIPIEERNEEDEEDYNSFIEHVYKCIEFFQDSRGQTTERKMSVLLMKLEVLFCKLLLPAEVLKSIMLESIEAEEDNIDENIQEDQRTLQHLLSIEEKIMKLRVEELLKSWLEFHNNNDIDPFLFDPNEGLCIRLFVNYILKTTNDKDDIPFLILAKEVLEFGKLKFDFDVDSMYYFIKNAIANQEHLEDFVLNNICPAISEEVCPMCSSPIMCTSYNCETCSKGHFWVRCSATFLLTIDAEINKCMRCSRRYYQASAFDSVWLKSLCEKTTYCNMCDGILRNQI